MAGRGPAPKDPEKRERRNAEVPMTDLAASPAVDAPELPNAESYSDATRDWYATGCRSPQAAQFLTTDWQRLHMLASLVDRYFAQPDARLLGEIRLNEAKLGATPEDRLRLRWRMAEAERGDERARKDEAKTKKPGRRADPRLKLLQEERGVG